MSNAAARIVAPLSVAGRLAQLGLSATGHDLATGCGGWVPYSRPLTSETYRVFYTGEIAAPTVELILLGDEAFTVAELAARWDVSPAAVKRRLGYAHDATVATA